MRDGLSGLVGDPGFERSEIVCKGLILKARVNLAYVLEIEPESATGKVHAEHMEDACPGENGQVGPDGQELMLQAQQPTEPRVRAHNATADRVRASMHQSCTG